MITDGKMREVPANLSLNTEAALYPTPAINAKPEEYLVLLLTKMPEPQPQYFIDHRLLNSIIKRTMKPSNSFKESKFEAAADQIKGRDKPTA